MAKGGDGPQETEADRAVAQVAKERVADWRTRWRPQQQQLAAQVDATGAADSFERRRSAGAVTADADVAFADVSKKALSASAQAGTLGSSGQKLGIGTMANDQASTVGLATNQSDLNVDAAHKVGLAGVVARGQGKEARADLGLTSMAQMERAQADDAAQASLERDMGNATLIGKAAGVGLGMFGGPSTDPAKTGVYQERDANGFGRPVNTASYGGYQ